MSFLQRTLALLLAVTCTVTALPTSNTPRDDVPIQGVGHAAPPPFNPNAPKPRILQISHEELAAAVANVTSGHRASPGVSTPKERRSSSSASAVSGRAVIGADNRVYWPSTDYPYSAMGRLYRSDGLVCTGTLIGPRHVTTAKHCIPSDGSVSIKFQPAYDGKDRFPSAYVTDVLAPAAGASDQCNYKDDWAVVVLDTRLGDARGYMSYDVLSPAKADQAIFYSYGYPSDKSSDVSKPYRQEAITVAKAGSFKCDQYGPLNTNADANGGQSGSPLWLPPDASGARVMYGVMASSSATVTFFAGGEVWAGGIQYMLSSYP
ncbi:trypsin-like cysteine/serine peptidase domain-containing protein [Apiospora marii]|uniref:trypsin-like cysteine/serine peptidase domain-containing protein n=1 Tax=Apiospora marii TaxID=335849 RepID=UPI00312D32D3